MKVVFLGGNDWGNTSNRICRAINRAGGSLNARCITQNLHPLGYEEDVVIGDDGAGLDHARDAIMGADWVVSAGDGHYDAFDRLLTLLDVDRGAVRLGTRHAGTRYRRHQKRLDAEDREWGFECRLFAPDLYRFAVDDPTARPFVQPQDTTLDNVPGVDDVLRICHTPRAREIKGTELILRGLKPWLKSSRAAIVDLVENVAFETCRERRNRCHVFVDQINPTVGGYGASAQEAMSAGLAVLADVSNVVAEVERWFPRPPIIHVQSVRDLRRELKRLIKDPEALASLRASSLEWAKAHLSSRFAGQYYSDAFA